MIFKVYYQESKRQVPVRENTKSLYLESSSIVEARKTIEKKDYHIIHIEEITGPYLEYEKQSENFVLLETK